jgi:hypothetical protein
VDGKGWTLSTTRAPTPRAAFEEGEREGEQKGAESVRREFLSEGSAEQVGRSPTPDEQTALTTRARRVT